MREVEIKAKLKNKDSVMQALVARGCVFEDSITQDDVVFVKNIGSYEIYDDNDVFLRIRVKNNKKIIFTIKKPLLNDMDCLEYETVIDSKEQMESALLLMGYQKAVEIKKTRITTVYEGCEICIDEVDNLGSFIEMEKLLPDDVSSENVQNELFAFFRELGIEEEDRISLGYDNLILIK